MTKLNGFLLSVLILLAFGSAPAHAQGELSFQLRPGHYTVPNGMTLELPGDHSSKWGSGIGSYEGPIRLEGQVMTYDVWRNKKVVALHQEAYLADATLIIEAKPGTVFYLINGSRRYRMVVGNETQTNPYCPGQPADCGQG